MSLASLIKRLQDIMRKDSGVDGDAQRLAQIVWLIFLKVYDYKEEEAELDDDYVPVIPTTIPVPSSCRALAMMMTTDTTGRLTSRTKRMTKLFALSQAARP